MKNKPNPLHRQGFALVVTLSLMILLTVVAVGMLTLSSISLRAASIDAAQQTARQNARMALMLALGELQVHLGPDKRITARAETLGMDSRVGSTVSPGSPQAWWVGVSDSDRSKKLGGSEPKDVVWLVSGLSGNTPGSQLATPAKPVDMVGSGSLDLAAFTGGKPIQAGLVPIEVNNEVNGGYAYYIDDNGMKAQLAASRPEVRNDRMVRGQPLGGGVLPGTYPLGILDQMSGLGDSELATYQKLASTSSLPLIGLSQPLTRSKFFSYTTSSQGVLADVKHGGLKKDLTIAFENPTVFSRVFPASQPNNYIVMDPAKRPPELGQGYIHWAIFRDYYNLKSHIRTIGGIPSLAPHLFEKHGLIANQTTAFHRGELGPHAMAGAASQTTLHKNQPYGQFPVSPTQSTNANPSSFMHNPIGPVFAMLHQNAWISRNNAGMLRTNVQMFTSHYNPYNVGLNMHALNSANVGPRVIRFPQVLFTAGGINRQPGLDGKLQVHSGTPVMLEPGRSHVMGFRTDGAAGSEIDGQLYSQQVGQIVTQSVYRDHNSPVPARGGQINVVTEFVLPEPSLMQGMDENPGDKEISQVFFAPFAWDSIPAYSGVNGPRPGKKFTRSLSSNELNENSAVSLGFFLRTTREKNSPIRPLVDANIRATWNNPKWDSPLNLPLLAAYSADLDGEAPQRMPQMMPGSNARGFSYWGNDRQPSGANDRVILFDIPRRDLLSLGQLQHANAGRFSYEPTYIVGNSYANLRIPLDDWKASISDTYSASRKVPWPIPGRFNLYDASYLVNEVIFDSYTFTTIPQQNDNFGGGDVPASDYPRLLAGTAHLPNPRFIPYRPAGSNFTAAELGNAGDATRGSFFHNAGHVLVDGAFNVNSTSVDAWEAFLSGTHNLPVQKLSSNGVISSFVVTDGVRFPRAASHVGQGMKTSSIDDNYWTGFRELTQEEVRKIATELVSQIKQRGPFLSLGEFVNRQLVTTELGKSGALQAALDASVNQGLPAKFESAANHRNIPERSTQGAGFPGQLLQGDILQALAPYMTVRSDTFTIRGYGEARASNKVTAKAYCEAVVQRLPDPMQVSSSRRSQLEELALPSSPFGRQFKIVSFRWLAPAEV